MDVVQLEQVIMNLCINARDAMNGQGDIEVKLQYLPLVEAVCVSCHEPVKGDYVQLSVRDNGSGIPEENIEHLFEPFYTTKEVGQGSGLGLSMAHGIVHEHGGHILVETDVGMGTCFRLLFPPLQVESEQALPKVKRTISVPKHSINANILLVDDDVSLAKFVALLLESEGYSVFIKHNAADALMEYKEGKIHFDLIVTDQVMPKMSGIDMSKQLLAITPDLPIILYSGFDRNTSKEQCFALGIKGFLRKPFDNNDLLNMVQNCLEVRV
jgi:CheY-like chemotaxis protein